MSELKFEYEDLYHPRLKELREREPIQRVIFNGKNHFERLVLLRHWVASQWRHRRPNPYPPHDAIEILDSARAGGGGHCGQFGILYLQSCLAVGYQARAIEVGSRECVAVHFPIEVWIPDYQKWAVMEADSLLNCYYVLQGQGIPLSGLEIHDQVVTGNLEKVEMVTMWPGGIARTAIDEPQAIRQKWVERFYYLRVVFKQDFLSNPCLMEPPDNTFERYETAVEWLDEHTVPWERSEFSVPHLPNAPVCRRQTSRKEDLYFKPKYTL